MELNPFAEAENWTSAASMVCNQRTNFDQGDNPQCANDSMGEHLLQSDLADDSKPCCQNQMQAMVELQDDAFPITSNADQFEIKLYRSQLDSVS